MDKYKFGEFIYQKRKKQGLTQEELGKRLGVTNKAVSKWEVGETTPDITMLEPLAKELQVTVDELLKQETTSEKNEQTIKVNKLFIVLTISLAALNILTIIIIALVSLYNHYKQYPVIIDQTNYQEVINIDPLTNFICDNQAVIIKSSYGLDNKYYIKENEEITFVIEYEINYYYLDNSDNLCVITYFARTKAVTLTSQILFETDEIRLEPKSPIQNFKSFKNIEVKHIIYDYQGTVYKIK
jgi:transcriptional regulator with XRE-family HTH domain